MGSKSRLRQKGQQGFSTETTASVAQPCGDGFDWILPDKWKILRQSGFLHLHEGTDSFSDIVVVAFPQLPRHKERNVSPWKVAVKTKQQTQRGAEEFVEWRPHSVIVDKPVLKLVEHLFNCYMLSQRTLTSSVMFFVSEVMNKLWNRKQHITTSNNSGR